MGLVQYRTHIIRGPIETRRVLLIRSKLQHLRSTVPVPRRTVWYYEEYDELIRALREERRRFYESSGESYESSGESYESKKSPLDLYCDLEPWADECRVYDS
jgi:hypothetical protein